VSFCADGIWLFSKEFAILTVNKYSAVFVRSNKSTFYYSGFPPTNANLAMSRRQSRSKSSNSESKHDQGLSVRSSGQKRRLSALTLVTVLIVAGSYYWFRFKPPPLVSVQQPTVADGYRAAIATEPENYKAHYNLGLVLQSQGKNDEAIFHYQRAIEITGGDVRYHNNLGAALSATGKLDEAIRHFNQAIEFDPNNSEVRFNFGNALFLQEKLEEAMVQFRRTIQLKPDHAKAHNNLAVALKKSGYLKEAFQHRNEAMRLERSQQGLD